MADGEVDVMRSVLQVVTRSIRWCLPFIGWVLSVAGSPAFAEVASSRYAITPEQVTAVMQEKHLPLDGAQIRLAVPMTASVAAPLLEVKTVSMTTPYRAQMKVVCRNPGECLPFYVAVSWPEDAPQPAIPSDVLQQSRSSSVSLGKSSAVTIENPLVNERAKTERTQSEVALKPGAPATLVMDDERVHIRMKVVCLQAGAAGDKVRVSTPDHKQAFVGEVVSPTLLKGSL